MEITIEYAHSYLLDRIKELRHNVKDGTPFVIINTLMIACAIGSINASLGEENLLIDQSEFCPLSLTGLGAFLHPKMPDLFTKFSLNTWDTDKILGFSHNANHKFVRDENLKVLAVELSAPQLLTDIECVINAFFALVKQDERRSLVAKTYLNKHPFIGLSSF